MANLKKNVSTNYFNDGPLCTYVGRAYHEYSLFTISHTPNSIQNYLPIIFSSHQCDKIWRIFANLVILKSFWPYLVLVNCGNIQVNFVYAIRQIFILVNCQFCTLQRNYLVTLLSHPVQHLQQFVPNIFSRDFGQTFQTKTFEYLSQFVFNRERFLFDVKVSNFTQKYDKSTFAIMTFL